MQVAINMGSVLSLIPVAGVTLPLVSYGGSSLLSVYIALGFVLGVARRTEPIRQAILARRKPKAAKNSQQQASHLHRDRSK
jgi:cell division protein FtsW